MTKQNAANANQANNLMKNANEVVGTANESMKELTVSMTEISKASDETSKIIKTIDEIAFQTNLLALNAAVEAARRAYSMRPTDFAAARDLVRLYLRLNRRTEAASFIEDGLRSNRRLQAEAWTMVIQQDLGRARDLGLERRPALATACRGAGLDAPGELRLEGRDRERLAQVFAAWVDDT